MRIHLVLNAAYEVPLLVAQARAYAALPIEDLILTHLDEEARWGKIWNVVLGTNYPVRFLSAAQNVPGEIFSRHGGTHFSSAIRPLSPAVATRSRKLAKGLLNTTIACEGPATVTEGADVLVIAATFGPVCAIEAASR